MRRPSRVSCVADCYLQRFDVAEYANGFAMDVLMKEAATASDERLEELLDAAIEGKGQLFVL